MLKKSAQKFVITIFSVLSLSSLFETAQAQSILMDFGTTLTTNPTNGLTWNNYTNNSYLNLVTSQGNSTTYYFTPNVGGTFNTGFVPNGANLSGLGTFNNINAASDAIYTTTSASYYLYNINPNLTYDFTILGSRDSTTTRVTTYTAQGSNTGSGSVTTSGSNIGGTGINYNNSSLVNITGITSTNFGGGIGNGIQLTLTATTGGFAYLNAMSAEGYIGYLSGGTTTLNGAPAAGYVANGTYANGDSRSVNTVIGGGSTVTVNNANGIYYNSTLIMTNGGGAINAGTNFSAYSLAGSGNLAVGGSSQFSITHAGTYAGNLSLNNGNLNLAASNALGSGNLALNGGSLEINNASALGSGAVTVASGTTTINNASSLTNLAGNNTITFNGGGATLQVNGYGKTLSLSAGNVSVTGTNNLNAWNGGMQFDGVVSGSGVLNWYGGGNLTLGNANTYTGTITASGNNGTLTLANTNALQNATLNKGLNQTVAFGVGGNNTYNLGSLTGAGDINLGGNNLNVTNGGSYSGALSGSGGLRVAGSMALSGSNTYSGDTTINGGTLTVGAGGGSGQLGSGGVINNGSLVINRTGTLSVTGAISGAGSVTVTNTGFVILSGNNSYSGTTTIKGGTLAVGSGGASGQLGGGNILNDGALVINRTGTLAVSNQISGTGSLIVTNTGSVTLGGINSFSGGTTLYGASLNLTASNALGSGGLVVNGGSVDLNHAAALGSGALTFASGTTTINNASSLDSLAGNNSINLSGGWATMQVNGYGKVLNLGTGNVSVTGNNNLNAWNGGFKLDGVVAGSGLLNWYGGGNFVLGAANTFSGTVTASGNNGTLTLANTNALQNAILNKGSDHTLTFGVAGDNTYNLKSLTGSGDINLGGNSFNITNGATYAGNLSGTGGLRVAGETTLSGSNSFSGGIEALSGQLNVNSASALGTGTLTLRNGTQFRNSSGSTVVNSGNNTVLINGTNNFTGGTLDLGTGTVTLGGASRLNTTGGELILGGNLTGSSTFAKDGIGTLTLAGSNSATSFVVLDYGTLALANTNALANANLYLYGTTANKKTTFAMTGNNNYNIGELSGTSTGVLDIGANTVTLGGSGRSGSFAGQITGTGGNFTKAGSGVFSLAGSNSYTGQTSVRGGTLSVTGDISSSSATTVDSGAMLSLANGGRIGSLNNSGTTTVAGNSGSIINSGTVAVSGSAGNLSNSGTATISGTAGDITSTGITTIQSGATSGSLVVNGGTSTVNGTAGNTTINSGGKLRGSGTVGALEIASGGTLAVGNSPGTLNVTGNAEWAGGGIMAWELASATGNGSGFLAGQGGNWDFLNIAGSLNISANHTSQFIIDIVSLLALNDTSFDVSSNYSFAIATAAGGINSFSTSAFNITGYLSETQKWSLSTVNNTGSSQSLILSYTGATAIPEPTTWTLMMVGLAGFAFRRRFRE